MMSMVKLALAQLKLVKDLHKARKAYSLELAAWAVSANPFGMPKEDNSQNIALGGWRRSANRTDLHTNSLPTGNFIGNFATIRPHGRYEQQETTVLQPLLELFPTEPIRENSLTNRERKTRKQGICKR